MTDQTLNLYAVLPEYAPYAETHLMLAASDEEALNAAIYAAASDATKGYGSTTAKVWCVAENVRHVGVAHATDAPRAWEWAHPAVEESIADDVLLDAEFAAERPDETR